MNIVIIGSYGKKEQMEACKAFWERFGHKVSCPCDPGREKKPLIEKQSEWIKKIQEADLVVAIHKDLCMSIGDEPKHIMEFGESTSYEMAIALLFQKQIVYWG